MEVDERSSAHAHSVEEAPPTKKLCSCGADLSSLSVYHRGLKRQKLGVEAWERDCGSIHLSNWITSLKL